MVDPPLFFVSGLPRSGSTLLMNLLGQNPRHHVTPTNDLLDLLVHTRDIWPAMNGFSSQGIDAVRPRVLSSMREMVSGFYREEFAAGKIVFDKSRGWLAYIELMEAVLHRPIHILVTVRDVRAIVASFEKLNQRHPITDPKNPAYAQCLTVEGRVYRTLADPGIVGLAINRLRDALGRDHRSKIVVIPYNKLCRDPRDVMAAIHQRLDIPPYQYDPQNVQQITVEDDAIHGMPLHTIRAKVELADTVPWQGVLPEVICNRIAAQFADIQKFAETDAILP